MPNESDTSVALWKYINDGNCDYLTLRLESHTLLCLLLGNSTKYNTVKPSTFENHGNGWDSNSKTFDSSRKAWLVRFPSRNKGVLCLSLIITIWKTATVKDLNKRGKSKIHDSKQIKPKAGINPSQHRSISTCTIYLLTIILPGDI